MAQTSETITLYQGELRKLMFEAMEHAARKNGLAIDLQTSEPYIDQQIDVLIRCLKANNQSKTIIIP